MKKKTELPTLMRAALLLAVILATTLPSHAFYVNGVYYTINSDGTTVSVIGNSPDQQLYSGSVTIPSTVTYNGNSYTVNRIQKSAFYYNKDLTAISMPNSIIIIDEYAFFGCSGLTSLTIPKSLTSMGHRAFDGCSPIKLTWNAKNCLFNGGMTTANITQVTIGSGVEVLPGGLASGSKITTVTIPNSVKLIGGSAFNNCTGLASVTIPSSVNSIGDYAFQGCTGLTSLTIPTSVNSIGNYAFQGCTSLKTLNFNAISCVDFNNSNSTANHCPFYDLNISTINIGNSVLKIPAYFAYGLSAVKSITIPNSVTYIGANAFNGCSPTNLVWNAKNIDNNGNMTTSDITQVTIGSGVEALPYGFVSGSKISSVTLPSTLKTIADNTFNNCIGLKSVTIPNKVTSVGYNAFYGCTSLTSVSIGNSVQTIGSYAFSGCTGLTSMTFPNSVTSIDGLAFSNCTNLNTISLPNSVFSLSYGAFAGCTKLAKVYCRAIMPPVITDNAMFDAVTYQNAILYVPDLTYGYYIQTNPWNLFHEIKTVSYSDGGTAFNSTIYPTSVRVEDASQTANGYFMFNGQRYNTRLMVTGLEPDHIYSATYTKGGVETPFKFYTSSLMMVPEGATMLTETTALLKAETNMADEETICGFDWRRYDGPEDYLGTRVYCPVYDGQMAGTLKNLTRDTFYKFRPFYKSSNGTVHYGDWVTFYTADAGVEFDPVVYTYNYPAVTQTEATLQGVALRGSDVITQQGFEYRKANSSTKTKVNATGERMSKTVTGLQPSTKYKFRAFVTAGGKTTYGDEVDFTTLSNSAGGDVNGDGTVNISDVTALINYLLRGSGSGVNQTNADVNGDGYINITDVTALIGSLLSGN